MTTDAADALAARLAAAQAARAAAGGVVGFQNPDEWLPRWLASQRRDAEKWHAAHPDEVESVSAKRRKRKPTLASAITQASKAGVTVTGATVAVDGAVVSDVRRNATDRVGQSMARCN